MQWGLRAQVLWAVLFVGAWPLAASAEPVGAGEAMARVAGLLREGYSKAPALMIGLGALLAVPPLALLGVMLRRTRRQTQPLAMEGIVGEEPVAAATAFVDVESSTGKTTRRSVDRSLMQIGREDDNDICLEEGTVHRYHAILERNKDDGLVITDVSGPEGNGVRLNGEKIVRAGLTNGDLVELGAAKLRVVIAGRHGVLSQAGGSQAGVAP